MRVIVIGGGLAGLFAASELVAAGVEDFVVVDRSDQPGGVADTIVRDGFNLEAAVGAMTLPHPHLSPILERVGVEMVPAHPAASVRQVYTNGRLISIPASPRAVLAPLVPWPAKLRALSEPLIPRRDSDDESLADFCRRRFGSRAGGLIAWLMASGVFAGDPERLSAESAFPMLTGLEQETGSVLRGLIARRRQRDPTAPRARLHYPSGGMATLSRAAADALGGRYQARFEVESLRREDNGWVVAGTETLRAGSVVLATSPGQAAQLVDAELAEHLREAITARVTVVGLGGIGDGVLPHGFGALIGPGEGMVSRGFLYESSYAPDRAPKGSWLLKVIAGGSPGGVPEGDIASMVLAEAEGVLGKPLNPTLVATIDDQAEIPQYEIGHRNWLERLDYMLGCRPGLFVTGWGYRGVGAAQLATDAVRLRREIVGG